MPANVRLLTAYLVSGGYDAISASGGEKALALAESAAPDLVLLDAMMPNMSGFEVCRRIKSDPRIQHIPVIMVTSLTSIDDKIRGQEAGADDFISKPIKRVELLLRVKSLLRIKSLHDQLSEKVAELEVAKSSLRELANTDPLTSLRNKRYLEETGSLEVERAARYRRPLSLVIADLDFFKQFNDAHGHPAGDILLRQVAALISQSIRNIDLASRYGGEEFVLVLPETGKEEAGVVAEKLRSQIESHVILDEGGQPRGRVTISAGVAAYPDDAADLAGLLRAADRRLYRAKEQGRNRVVIGDGVQPQNEPGGHARAERVP